MHFKQCHIKKTQESLTTGLLVIGVTRAEVRDEFTEEAEQLAAGLLGWRQGGKGGGSQ